MIGSALNRLASEIMPAGRTIGVLTGTFDPVHDGHLAIAAAALAAAQLDEVWLLPNPDPSHKLVRAQLRHRQAMIRLATERRSFIGLAPLSALDAARPHTWAGLQRSLGAFPADRFEFVVGMDTICQLDTWDDVESVVESTSYIVIHRAGSSGQDLAALRGRLGRLGPKLRLRLLDGDKIPAVSSSELRLRLAEGRRLHMLPEAVAAYIRQQRLYLS